MDVKLTVFIVIVVLGLLVDHSSADFFYNHPSPKEKDLAYLKLRCIPGRTVIKIEEKTPEIEAVETDSEEFTRRDYSKADVEERCKICICSAEGRDEYCSQRATGSLNECMLIRNIMESRDNADAFDMTKTLSYRIRRDLIWHNDEIPYDPDSKCFRGHSYYTNHDTPNDTDINYSEDIVSLLDYKSETCHYCVCSVSGDGAQCISRSVWFCNYLRYLRSDNGTSPQRDMYASMFKQDRPAYFRQLSHRLRRTMDSSLFTFIEHGGDTLCCNHPDGHRRQLHNTVHNKLRTLKRRIPKENLLGGPMGGDYVDFVVNND